MIPGETGLLERWWWRETSICKHIKGINTKKKGKKKILAGQHGLWWGVPCFVSSFSNQCAQLIVNCVKLF